MGRMVFQVWPLVKKVHYLKKSAFRMHASTSAKLYRITLEQLRLSVAYTQVHLIVAIAEQLFGNLVLAASDTK